MTTAERLKELMLSEDTDWLPYHCVDCIEDFPAELLEWCERVVAFARGDGEQE